MSRLHSNAEPSMEEILASIRKIIAEEPPGSRAAPAPRNGAPTPSSSSPAPQRGFMSREAFLRSSQPSEPEESEPLLPAAKNEPRVETANSNEPSLKIARPRDDFSASTARFPEQGTQEPVPSHSLAKNGAFVSAEEAAVPQSPVAEPKSEPAPEPPTETASIDAQLTELLSDGLEAMHATGSSTAGAATGLASAPAATPSAGPSQSPAAGQKVGTGRDGADPFTFDLGPSPFAPRGKSEATVSEPENAAPAAASTPIEAPRDTALASHGESSYVESPFSETKSQTNGASPGSALVTTTSASAPILMSDDAPSAAPAASRSHTAFAVPSVSATLGPSRNLEPLSDSFQTPATDVYRDRSQDRAGRSAETPLADHYRNAVRVEARQEPVDRVLQPAAAPPALPEETSIERSMEDAVADLLRPLLKTWLAENMPKIVERALRREMSERLLPGQKNTLD